MVFIANGKFPNAKSSSTTLINNSAFIEVIIFAIGCIVIVGIFGLENLLRGLFGDDRETYGSSYNGDSFANLSDDSYHSILDTNCDAICNTSFTEVYASNQSPININTRAAIIINENDRQPLLYNKQYFTQPLSMTIVNDGQNLTLGTCFAHTHPKINGGPLNNKYRFNLIQFKWGPTDDEGSEHTINFKRYAMEMQLMHIKGTNTYSTLDSAVKNQAVAYLSFLFEVTPNDNPFLEPLVDRLRFVHRPNSRHNLDPFPLCWLFHPFKSNYYYYNGSITSPPYTETVKWLIQPKPLGISHRQLNEFRNIMRKNSRPVQELNGRTIHFYI